MAGRGHIGIVDSEKMAALAEEHLRLFRLEQAKQWQEEQRANNIYCIDKDSRTYAEKEAQAGKRMDWKEFERKLKKLSCGHKLIFRDVKNRPGWRGVLYQYPDGTEKAISAYGKILLPEYSTIILKEKIERDFSVTHLNHLDFPKTEKTATGYETLDGSLKPGWVKYYESHGEDPNDFNSRGWRTVLLRLQSLGYASVAEIEKIFGRSDRKSWASGMGHLSNTGYIL